MVSTVYGGYDPTHSSYLHVEDGGHARYGAVYRQYEYGAVYRQYEYGAVYRQYEYGAVYRQYEYSYCM
jgi:hypothetical protein